MHTVKRRQAGDTIVEVMIVLAVLALAFAISYATANRGLQAARNAEEHTEALQFIDSQVELLRLAAAESTVMAPSAPTESVENAIVDWNSHFPSFCLTSDTAGNALPQAETRLVSSPDDSNLAANFNVVCQQGRYYEVITYEGSTGGVPDSINAYNNYFAVSVYWDGVGKPALEHVQLNYRIYGGGV